MNEKMKVLELLEAGKITAEEAAKLIDSLGGARFISKESMDNVEDRLSQFGKDISCFAKDAGAKLQELYKDLEPKIKKATQQAAEKAANALDNLANNINESIEAAEKATCCEDEKCECPKNETCTDDDAPKPN